MTEENTGENNNDETMEIDVTEISLDEDEINELIEKLQELRTTKDKIEFELDEENDLVINYEESEEDEE